MEVSDVASLASCFVSSVGTDAEGDSTARISYETDTLSYSTWATMQSWDQIFPSWHHLVCFWCSTRCAVGSLSFGLLALKSIPDGIRPCKRALFCPPYCRLSMPRALLNNAESFPILDRTAFICDLQSIFVSSIQFFHLLIRQKSSVFSVYTPLLMISFEVSMQI